MGAISFFKSLYKSGQDDRSHSRLSAIGPPPSDVSTAQEDHASHQDLEEYKIRYSDFSISLAVEDITKSVAFLRQVLDDSNVMISEALHNESFDIRLADGSDGGPVVRFENREKGDLFTDQGPSSDEIKGAIRISGIQLGLQVGSLDSLRTALSKVKAQWEDVDDATAVKFWDHEYVCHSMTSSSTAGIFF